MASTGRLHGPPAVGTHYTIHNPTFEGKPPMGQTENFSPAFFSTGNPCLDFFFHVVLDTQSQDLIQRLQLAWAHNALTTLKLIFNLRGVRGIGKSDKEGFYTVAFWLYKTHPKALALNVKALADFGYLKDLPEILYRLLKGPNVRVPAKVASLKRKMAKTILLCRRRMFSGKKNSDKFKREGSMGKRMVTSEDDKQRILECVDKEKARELRKVTEISKAAKALDRYNNDSDYRFLFDSVCDVFAELSKLDLAFLSRGEVGKISLAGKWCPMIDSSYDKSLLICEGITRRVFPRECEKEYVEIEGVHYVYRVRDRLRKQVLGPLHKALELPEVYMSANEWNTLPYKRVPSIAMNTYKELFTKHDKERFEEYLEKAVESGTAKIAAGALLPHQIIQSLNGGDGGKVAELQRERMVGDVAKKGKLKNCIAVCDVFSSMDGTPMGVCEAPGLLVSELSEEPWKGKVITFSTNPELHLIKGDILLAKTQFIRTMQWKHCADFVLKYI